MEKQKELWYVKAFQKGDVGPSTPFHFYIMAQLANIPARITLYELLRLFKSIKDVLREALADAEVFMTYIPLICGEEEAFQVNYCHHTSTDAEVFMMQRLFKSTIATTPQRCFPASPST